MGFIIIIIKNWLFAQAVSYRQYEDALTNKLYAKSYVVLIWAYQYQKHSYDYDTQQYIRLHRKNLV